MQQPTGTSSNLESDVLRGLSPHSRGLWINAIAKSAKNAKEVREALERHGMDTIRVNPTDKEFEDARKRKEDMDKLYEDYRHLSTPEPKSMQVGGTHYKDYPIQPIEYIQANCLGFCEGNVVKYVTRYIDKNGVEDLRKARHYIDLLIEDVLKNDV